MHTRPLCMKADYGIDAPGVVRNLGVLGGLLLVGSIFWPKPYLITPGVFLFGTAVIMFLGSKVFKLRFRDKVLDEIEFKGKEHVLDVGCGRGLMLIGAAKRVPNGFAEGVDLWRTADQYGNSTTATKKNIEAEGVDNVRLHTADMKRLPFPDQNFDVVLSSWAIHNIPDVAGRKIAIGEIYRVLRYGAQAVLVDIGKPKQYAEWLRALGCDAEVSGPNFMFVTPTWTVSATKVE